MLDWFKNEGLRGIAALFMLVFGYGGALAFFYYLSW